VESGGVETSGNAKRSYRMSDQKVVLVTGASSGVGQATARVLAHKGYKVFGTSRQPLGVALTPNVEMLALDVRDDESVAACLQAVISKEGRLDVLVNNAGYELAGAFEEVSLDEAKAQFETNFFGVIRMIKAVLPLMRRQGHGQIINISSLSGLSPIPFMGIYSASKFALEGYTEALRVEVKPFHIHVSQIEPGFLNTPMMKSRQVAASLIDEYDPWRRRSLKAVREQEEKGPGPELVAETVLKIIASSAPRLRYVIGQQAKSAVLLRQLLPEPVFQQAVRGVFSLDKNI
jgi:NAD(P)-dependent dehydrogenase (short-subunit alcohol dehydrogenase family)